MENLLYKDDEVFKKIFTNGEKWFSVFFVLIHVRNIH